MGQTGWGNVQDIVDDLDQRLQRLEMEYTLRVMRVQTLIDDFKNNQEHFDVLKCVRNIGKQLHLVQSDYELRTSRMQVEIDQHKSQMQTLGIPRYSSDTIGGSLSAPRY